MNNVDVLRFASVEADAYREVYEFLKKHQEPTYVDKVLKEDLYSVDVMDNLKEDTDIKTLPRFVVDFLYDINQVSNEIAYIRFVYL